MSQEDTLVKASGGSIVDRLIGDHQVSRRSVLKALGAGSISMAAGGILDACGSLGNTGGTSSAGTIKIGYVSPLTGPDAGFGEPDPYVVSLARKAWANGITVGSKKYDVQIITEDSQSGARAQQAASDLINTSNVDLILTTSAPETVNPVSDAAEAAGVPCISTVVPWEAWYFGRQANPAAPVPFKWTFHFAFGVAQFANAYEKLWPQVDTNKVVGVMWPNDADGNAIRGALGPLLKKAGYTIIDPGAYADGSTDYTAQISLFKQKTCEIFNTFPIPPDFVTFWEQAAQQGFKPKIAQIAKTGLFPSQVEALGSIGNGLASGVYWAPTWPYTSSLTGVSSADLATGYEASAKKEWNQQAGASLALFDVANAALKASGDPKNKQAVATAMKTLAVDTPLGHLVWGGTETPPNVVATPIIGGQWVATPGQAYPINFVICENANDSNVPIAATLTSYS
jgi:branched-chain amino acid transport system substrate-binding protein